jgi:hypothetical protein
MWCSEISRLATVERSIETTTNRLPEMSVILESEFSCNFRQLYEVTLMNLKNRLVALQKKRILEGREERNAIIDRIRYMETKFGEDSLQAGDEKEKLLRFDDVKLKERATTFREFLDVNNEKATRVFCKLSKEGGVCDNQEVIRNANGEVFGSGKDHNEYIRKYYEGVYKKRLDSLLTIESFLGEELAHVGWINDRKLSDQESLELEGEVTMDELKESLDNSNFGSTSGWDGISFGVIRNYWGIVSPLLLKMTNEMFREGELTETFKMGLIKLIPKKGDARNVEDWRPITLLNCGYKIISGVANRLEKFLPKIIGRAQKGFLKSKSIHTCILNVTSCVAQSRNNGEGMGVLCVNFSKAFDSLEHEAILACLSFFNFGKFMIKMVATILKDRKARIIVDDGYSDTFGILRGTPQGDRSSPYIFIICIEILLLKISLMEGREINACNFIKEKVKGINIEAITAEAYADDLTVIFKMLDGSLEVIIDMLVEYGRCSGLEINKKKTQLMITGAETYEVGERVHDIEIVGKVNILGIIIDRKLTGLDENWNRGISKMRKLCGYWTTFRLSITGRVMVCKTYIISQIVYLLGSLPLGDDKAEEINSIVINFISGTDRPIERRRQFLCAELGGYNMFDIHDMDTCSKSTWIRRWKKEMEKPDYSGVLSIGPTDVDSDYINGPQDALDTNKLLVNIMAKWNQFKSGYYDVANNIMVTKIFGNSILGERAVCVDIEVFGRSLTARLMVEFGEAVVSDFFTDNGRLREKQDLEERWRIPINWAEYFRLRGALVRIQREFRFDWINGTVGRVLEAFIVNKSKGCGRYRRVISGRWSRGYIENDPTEFAALALGGGQELNGAVG